MKLKESRKNLEHRQNIAKAVFDNNWIIAAGTHGFIIIWKYESDQIKYINCVCDHEN